MPEPLAPTYEDVRLAMLTTPSLYGDVCLAMLTALSLYLKAQYLNPGGIMKAFLCHICV
jgi:hypothetical protein